jgi:cephalosporin hydroxylase
MIPFNEKNITKKSNLEISDSLSAYLGNSAQQNHYAYEAFYNFLNATKPKRIVEIGTAQGGFTVFLKLCCNDLDLDTEIISYEIHDRPSFDFIRSYGVDIRIENIFTEGYAGVSQEAIDYIQQEGSTVVLCDGGHKISEFNLLSPFLKSGDYILAHDYACNSAYFSENIDKKYWNWLEIQDIDIQEVVDSNNLESFMQEQFNNAVWVCKIKK